MKKALTRETFERKYLEATSPNVRQRLIGQAHKEGVLTGPELEDFIKKHRTKKAESTIDSAGL